MLGHASRDRLSESPRTAGCSSRDSKDVVWHRLLPSAVRHLRLIASPASNRWDGREIAASRRSNRSWFGTLYYLVIGARPVVRGVVLDARKRTEP